MSKTLKKVLSVLLCAALLFGCGLVSLTPAGAVGTARSSILSAGPEGNVLANKSGTPLSIVTADDVVELKVTKQGGAAEVWSSGATDNGDGTKTWTKKYTFTEGRHYYTACAATADGYEAESVDFTVNATSRKVTIEVLATGLGNVIVYYNGGVKKTVTNKGNISVALGDVLTFVATPKTVNGYTYEFMYWTSVSKASTRRLIDSENPYKMTAVCDSSVEAQFSPNNISENENLKYIVYVNNAGNVVSSTEVIPEVGYTVPSAPVLQDHSFLRWSMTSEEAIASDKKLVVITPIYTMDETYTVSIQEGDYETWGAGQYSCKDDERVLANINASATNGAGQVFQYWLDLETNDVVSYSRGYIFYVIKDTALCPVYGDEPVAAQPVVRIAAVKFGKARVNFFVERSVPAAYEVIQSGIIVTKTAAVGEDESAFIIGANGVAKGTSISRSPDGYYSAVVSIDFDQTVWGRGYLIYRDAAGEYYTVYSPISSFTRT